MRKFNLVFYETLNGKVPAIEFLNSLDVKMRAKTNSMLKMLQNNGHELRAPYSKHLTEGIFELRTELGNNINRILYFFYSGGNIVITNGFIKKTKKTPRREIELAKKYRQDYLDREAIKNERKI